MNNYEIIMNLKTILEELSELRGLVEIIITEGNENEELWDNSDIIRKWNVSSRTLSEWRKKGLISYVQIQGKIWYPKDARDEFINKNLVPSISSKEHFNESGGKCLLFPPAEDDFICFIRKEE